MVDFDDFLESTCPSTMEILEIGSDRYKCTLPVGHMYHHSDGIVGGPKHTWPRLHDVVNQCHFIMSDMRCRLVDLHPGPHWYQTEEVTYRQPEKMDDPVHHPYHYTADPSGVECINITRHRTFNIGNAIKYLWRAGVKGETTQIEDLEKAIWYINDEIGRLNNGKH